MTAVSICQDNDPLVLYVVLNFHFIPLLPGPGMLGPVLYGLDLLLRIVLMFFSFDQLHLEDTCILHDLLRDR